MDAPDSASPPEFVLRLLVVKIEGVLIPSSAAWQDRLTETPPDGRLETHRPFPRWSETLNVPEPELRRRLQDLAETADWELEGSLRDVLENVYAHSPLRVAMLTAGPREWARGLTSSLGLSDYADLIYHFDRYPHGSRRTLFQFLMNRFIAGRARTLLVGDHPADERLADREGARFRAFVPPPEDARTPEHWNRNPAELEDELQNLQPDT